jgi:autotransporter-associated beta strand protein
MLKLPISLRICVFATFLSAVPASATAQTTHPVGDYTALLGAISAAQPGDTILFTANITLSSELPSILTDLTIDGGGFTLSGADQYRGLIVGDVSPFSTPPPVSVSIQDLTIANTVSTGGTGQSSVDGGGGGGAGLGGALFVAGSASVTLAGVNIIDSSAVGGGGGDASGISGGGAGGSSSLGSSVFFGSGGSGGMITGPAGYGGGGGGGGGSDTAGGFAGGSGSSTGGGGGGGALGGAVFVQSGGSLSVNGAVTINGSSVNAGIGGTGASGGSAYGAGLFLDGFGILTFTPSAGTTVTLSDGIADGEGVGGLGRWSLAKDGAGTLVLSGANTYVGGTEVNAGTLSVASDSNLGLDWSLGGGDVTLRSGATLQLTADNVFARGLRIENATTLRVGSGISATWSNFIDDSDGPGSLTVTGGGTLTLANPTNAFTGGLAIVGNSTVQFTDDGALGEVDEGVQLGDVSSGGTLRLTSGITTSTRDFTFGGPGSGTFDVAGASQWTINGQISGPGTLAKAGDGTLVLSGANTYAGGTQVLAGTLRAGAVGVFGTGVMDVQSGTLDLNNFAQSLGSLSGGPSSVVTLGTAALTVGTDGTDAVFQGSIAGTGPVTKDGSGNWTLTGANTYTGGTNVVSGALIGSTVSLQGNILNDASVVFDQAFAGTYSGSMNGFGSLTKSGSGSVTLTGTNTYSGGTTVSGGVLIGSTTSVQGNIVNNAAVAFDQAVAGTYTGVMSGTGVLDKIGAGALTLTASNTFTGGVGLFGGVLRAGAADVLAPTVHVSTVVGTIFDLNNFNQTIGSIAASGDVSLGAGVLAVGGNGANSSVGGIISGAGALVKNGTGSLTLTGANNYLGGTTVSGGTLIGTTTSLQGNILNNAFVTFDQATTGTYAGVMTGTGSLTKAGAGTVTLAGANTYSGGTFVNGGILAGTSATLQGNIVNNAAVRFDQSFAGTYAGTISGTGSLTKSGVGTLTLSGNNVYSGATSIEAGVLRAATANVFSANSTIGVASGATFDLNGFDQSTGSLSGAGNITLGAATLTTGGNNSTSTLSGVISGTGSLVKVGTGALTLLGTNTYSGGTGVLGGSLVGNTTSLQGNIFNNALVVFDQAADGLYGGSMSGAGSLTKTGAGTLTLSGVNTYTGGTTVAAGTLVGNSSSLQGNIFTNGLIVFDQSGSGTFLGGVSGAGGLLKTGAGTLTLGGVSSYTGATTINSGVLQAGAANVFSANGPMVIAGGATLDLNGFDHTLNAIAGTGNIALGSATLTTGTDGSSSVVTGVLSGTGSLVKAGAGTLALLGANSYSGGTTVSGGILLGNSTSLQGDMFNNSRVVFDQGFNGTYAGAMSGSGILEKAGSGILTLTGSHTHTGGTLVSGGSLVGTTANLRGLIVNNSQLTFGGEADGTFNGTLEGVGAWTKAGTGTLTLNGTHLFSGVTTVSQGTLALNGILGGSVNVEPGALFQATGALLGTLNLHGTLSIPTPGFSALTAPPSSGPLAATNGDRLTTAPLFTIGGNLVAGPGSVLGLPLGPGPNPTMFVNGVAALNGTQLDATPIELGTQRRLSFLALTAAGGLTVADSTVATQNPLLVSSLRQDGNTLAVTILNLGVPLESAAGPGLSGVGAAIDRLKGDMSGDRGFVVRELLALNDDELNVALRTIAGELHASKVHLEVRSSEVFTDLVRSQMTDREHEAEEGTPGWGGPTVRWFGSFSREHSSFSPQGNALGGGANLSDGVGGFEFKLSPRFLIGGGGGLGFGSMSLDGLSGGSDVQAPRAFGLVGFRPKGFGIRGGGSFSRSKSKSTRRILIVARLPQELGGLPLTGGIDREAVSDEVTVQSDQWTEYADHQDLGTYRLDYMFGVRRARFARDGFTETGAGALSLESPGEIMNLTDTDVKIHLWRRKGGIRPYFETLFRRSNGFAHALPVEFAAEEDSDFETAGLPMGANAFAGRAGITLVRRLGTFTFEYRFRKTTGQTSQSGDLRFRF